MERIIAYCGLVCSECEAYLLTQANDTEGQEKLLAKWRVEYSAPEMKLEDVICDGCVGDGRHGGYCGLCEIRACGVERGVSNCAHCTDYACEKLTNFFAMVPPARETLEGIRSTL